METKYATIHFNLERAKRITNGEEEGKIVTRDGRNVRIISFDKKGTNCIVALIEHIDEHLNINFEDVLIYGESGTHSLTHELDLLLSVPEWTTFKDGDVVVSYTMPFIYNGRRNKNYGYFGFYCGLNSEGELCFSNEDDNDMWSATINGLAGEDKKQILVEALKSSDNPLAAEYLKRFFPEHSNSENIGKDYKFEPFDKVLVRGKGTPEWTPRLFDSYYEGSKNDIYLCQDNVLYNQCIPYNEKTKHLSGTTNKFEE